MDNPENKLVNVSFSARRDKSDDLDWPDCIKGSVFFMAASLLLYLMIIIMAKNGTIEMETIPVANLVSGFVIVFLSFIMTCGTFFAYTMRKNPLAWLYILFTGSGFLLLILVGFITAGLLKILQKSDFLDHWKKAAIACVLLIAAGPIFNVQQRMIDNIPDFEVTERDMYKQVMTLEKPYYITQMQFTDDLEYLLDMYRGTIRKEYIYRMRTLLENNQILLKVDGPKLTMAIKSFNNKNQWHIITGFGDEIISENIISSGVSTAAEVIRTSQ